MKSPLQALIQMGVVPTVTFSDRQPLLRHEHVDLRHTRPARPSRIWRAASCRSRARRTSPPSRSTRCTQGDRLDLIAAKYLGDPLIFWLICDANGAIAPHDLVATPGTVLNITTPQGVPGAPSAR